MLSNTSPAGPGFGEQTGGALVGRGTLVNRDVSIHRGAQEGMDEAKWSLVEHTSADQQFGGPRRVGETKFGQPRCLIQLATLQNGNCTSKAARAAPQPREP